MNGKPEESADRTGGSMRVRTPLGVLEVELKPNGVTRVIYAYAKENESVDRKQMTETRGIRKRTRFWFRSYFAGQPVSFTPLLRPRGSSFQRKVWGELRRIPAGSTRTYGEVAKSIGKEGAARAVGQACGRNPLPILIPCHRVVSAGTGIGGYSGPENVKKKLLDHEAQMRSD